MLKTSPYWFQVHKKAIWIRRHGQYNQQVKVDDITGINGNAVYMQDRKRMNLLIDIVHAWRLFFRKAHITQYQEISSCFFMHGRTVTLHLFCC